MKSLANTVLYVCTEETIDEGYLVDEFIVPKTNLLAEIFVMVFSCWHLWFYAIKQNPRVGLIQHWEYQA